MADYFNDAFYSKVNNIWWVCLLFLCFVLFLFCFCFAPGVFFVDYFSKHLSFRATKTTVDALA